MRLRLLWTLLVLGGLFGLSLSSSATDVPGPAVPLAHGARLPVHSDMSTPFNLSSLPALIEHEYDGRDLRLGRIVERGLAFTRYEVSYRSGSLNISGVMNVPRRPGRFPVIVLAHGYADPATYRTGAGLRREQAYLASSGYVVLHTDYRNFAASDRDLRDRGDRPLGYPEDLINAALAIKAAGLPFVDTERIGLFGRSMGGGVTLSALAAYPGLADAAVLSSPVSSDAGDGFDRWVRGTGALEDRVVDAYGTPESNPRFWAEVSPRGYLGRVTEPVLIHHGTADDVCRMRWSEATAGALARAGKDVQLVRYAGEGHHFDEAWPRLMRRTVDFFDRQLEVRPTS